MHTTQSHLVQNPQNISPQEYLQAQFAKEIFDEFIEPASFNYDGIQKEDGIIFVNFGAIDEEIVSALGNVKLSGFTRKNFTKVPLLTMTPYDKTFDVPILFPKESIKNTLAEVISGVIY